MKEIEDILSLLDASVKEYFISNGVSSKDFYCRKCGKLMVDVIDLAKYKYTDDGFFGKISKKAFWKLDENAKKWKKVDHEPKELRWLLFGKILHGCNDRRVFRHLCWDCMYDDLHTVVDIRQNARKKAWYKRIENGERPIPPYNVASNNYFKLIFDITDEEMKAQKALLATASEAKFIKKFGENEGKDRWKKYCEKQGAKNTREYKMKVKGWSEEEWRNFNKLRASTLENFILRYGESDGKAKWEAYCKNEAYVGNKLEYFIEKLGEEEGRKKYEEVCSMKTLSLKNFVRKYGEEEGKKRYQQYLWSPTFLGYSMISLELFKKIDERCEIARSDSQWLLKNCEAELEVVDRFGKTRIVHPDFLLGKKIIEFNGDYWHANPMVYNEDDEFNFDGNILTAKQIRENDFNRQQAIEKCGYLMYFVWELDYRNDSEKVVKECIDFLMNG